MELVILGAFLVYMKVLRGERIHMNACEKQVDGLDIGLAHKNSAQPGPPSRELSSRGWVASPGSGATCEQVGTIRPSWTVIKRSNSV